MPNRGKKSYAGQAMTLGGVAFQAGDPIPTDILDGLPERNRGALERTGAIVRGNAAPKLTGERRKAQQATEAARKAVSDAEAKVADLDYRARAAEQAVEEKAGERRGFVVQALEGDDDAKAKADALKREAADLQTDADDLRVALQAAQDELTAARDRLHQTEVDAAFADADALVEERGKVADEIDKGLSALADRVAEFRAIGHRLAAATGDGGQQTHGNWRLNHALNYHLDLEPLSGDERERMAQGFGTFERKVLRSLVDVARNRATQRKEAAE